MNLQTPSSGAARRSRRIFTDRLLVDGDFAAASPSDLVACREALLDWASGKLPTNGNVFHGWRDQAIQGQGMRFETVNGHTETGAFVWALRLSHPDQEFNERRVWVVESSLAADGQSGRGLFSLRLSTIDQDRTLPRPTPTTPRFVLEILKKNALHADGVKLVSGYTHLCQPEQDVSMLAALIQNPSRSRPVLLIPAIPAARINQHLSISQIASAVPALAHVFVCSRPVVEELCLKLGSSFNVQQGSLRCFQPGFSCEDSEGQHPEISILCSPDNTGALMALKLMAQDASLERANPDDVAPRFSEIQRYLQGMKRGATMQRIDPVVELPQAEESAPVVTPAEAVDVKTVPAVDPRDQRLAELGEQVLSLTEEVRTLEDLLQIASGETERHQKIHQAELARSAELLKQIADMKSRPVEAEIGIGPAVISRQIFPPLTELEEWAAFYTPHLAFSDVGLKAGRKSTYARPEEVYRGLLLLEHWREMRIYGGDALRQDFLEAVSDSRLIFQRSGTPKTLSTLRTEYTFTIPEAGPMLMNLHLKAGNSMDPRYSLRIYFAEELTPARKVAVGWLTSHLENNMT